MRDKLCCWISDFGNLCNRKLRISSPRIVPLYNGKRGYLCKSHQKANNNKKDYKRNKTERLGKQKTNRNKPNVIIKEKKRSSERYFARAGHPYFVWNAAKKYWRGLGQKFSLTYKQVTLVGRGNYNRLYTAWERSKFQERLTPMITKLHFKRPYSKNNFVWVTFEVAGYNPGYMKEVLTKVKTYHKNLLKRTLEMGGISTHDEFL